MSLILWKWSFYIPFKSTTNHELTSTFNFQTAKKLTKFFKDLGKIKSFYFTSVDSTLREIILESNQALLLDWNESFSFYIQCQISGVDYVFDITFSRDFSLAERYVNWLCRPKLKGKITLKIWVFKSIFLMIRNQIIKKNLSCIKQ